MSAPTRHRKGRGAVSNRVGRFESIAREAFDDGWGTADEPAARLETSLIEDASRSAIAYNQSPDIPFDRAVNPYRGCEHGCVYCYARPSHTWLGYSAGLDFESRLHFKPRAAALLREALAAPGYAVAKLALGSNTDPYQPIERKLGITRQILEVLAQTDHPVGVVTKASLVERDLDLLAPMAERGLCTVAISITSLDRVLARRMEPRASAPQRRMETVRRLSTAGIPVAVFVAPVIPFLNDDELESILIAAREAGAVDAWYSFIRLPLEIADLFEEWLSTHYPDRHGRVMERIRDSRGGSRYESEWGVRLKGRGAFAALIAQRFALTKKRLGFPGLPEPTLTKFRAPLPESGQLPLL